MLNGKILLTPPKYLNDPWEFFVQAEQAPDEELKERFCSYERDYNASVSQLALPNSYQQLPEADRWKIYRDRIKGVEFQNQTPGFFREEMSALFGVVSLSENPLNRIMWSHYGDLNKGIAIGFQTDCEQAHQSLIGRGTPLGTAIRVNYTVSKQTIHYGAANSALVFTTKHPDWAYELEWRVIQLLAGAESWNDDGKTYYALRITPSAVSHVVFGLSTPEELKIRIRDWLSSDTTAVGIVLIEQARLDPVDQRFFSE